ncbi:MAG: sigma factor [Solirubrobacteraceae bacterium]
MPQSDIGGQIADEFERRRPHLLRVAYSHLGSLSEAEDLVQEAWLRLVGAEPTEIREVLAAFLAATEAGDIASLVELLDPAVTFRSDGGGLVNAARKVFTGADRVAHIFAAMAHHFGERFRASPVIANGAPGLLLDTGENPSVVSFTLDGGRISSIDIVQSFVTPRNSELWGGRPSGRNVELDDGLGPD